MEPTRVSPEVQEALQELSQYLSDTMPPMMVAGAVELLATQPPVLVAEQVRAWTAAQYQGRLTIAKLNVDENPDSAAKYGIRGIPTLMLFKDGKVAATKVGALSRTQLQAFLDEAL